MTDYERYKRRVELAEVQGWTVYTGKGAGMAKCWIPPGKPINRAYTQLLPSLESLEKAAKDTGEVRR